MSRARAKRHAELVRQEEAQLAMAVDAALESADAFNAALEARGVPMRRLAILAWRAHVDAARVWTHASWTVTERRNLRLARAGKRLPVGAAIPFPGEPPKKARRRAAA